MPIRGKTSRPCAELPVFVDIRGSGCFVPPVKDLGLLLIIAGGAVVLVGALLVVAGRLSWLGDLPGDLNIRGKGWSFSFPLATCILISVVLTVVLNLLLRLWRK